MDIALVGFGGCLGAIARYLINKLLTTASTQVAFPLGTLTVNIVGCFIIGVLAQIGESRIGLSPPARLLLITGILGGFTTFSAFGNETVLLTRTDQLGAALLNLGIHIVLGLGAVWLGRAVASAFTK